MFVSEEGSMNDAKGTIRVLVADDFPITRAGIRTILEKESDIEIVGEAQDGLEAKQMVADLQPDILLLDLVMPNLQPYEVEEWVRNNYPETVTLVLTAHDRNCYLAKTIEAGVVGYLLKDEAPYKLVQAIRCAARGEIFLTQRQLTRANLWRDEIGKAWESLTRREREVLALLARGQSTQQIASTLTITVSTVDTHIGNVLDKLSVSSRAEAVAWVWQCGVLEE
jgi:NarL family two-component system response regulator LiaR